MANLAPRKVTTSKRNESKKYSLTTRRHTVSEVRVAIVGVGNCASSLVQGVEYYKDADPKAQVPGLMHVQFGDYHVRDVKFVVAFDVDAKKVGEDLSAAIFASENNTIKFSEVPLTGITVLRGHTYDGLGKYYRDMVVESDDAPVDVVQTLKDAKVDVLVCYLPVGSEEAAKFYAQCAIDAGVGFVNALPVFIAGTKEWADKFTAAVVPSVGNKAFAGTKSSPLTTCGNDADNEACTNLLTPRLTSTKTASKEFGEWPVITTAIASMVTTRTKFARSKIVRRDQRSISTPTKGPITEYGSRRIPKANAIFRGSDSRWGENKTNVASAVCNKPSPAWPKIRTPSSSRAFGWRIKETARRPGTLT